MSVQLSKYASQRSHWYVKAAFVLQLPLSVLSCFPMPGAPPAMGGTVGTGGPVSPLAAAASSASTARTQTRAVYANGRQLRPATFLHLPGTRIPERRWGSQQGRRDSNPRPTVLETAALPTELRPCAGGPVYRCVSPPSGRASRGHD